MANRKLVSQKVRQLLYGGDAYDATDVFDTGEYRTAKRMLSDHIRPDGDETVKSRARNAVEQLDRVLSDSERE